MKTSNSLTLTTSPPSQPARKLRETASLTRRQRPLYRRKRQHSTGKERDSETGLYYYGARYLDGRTGRWLSGDPAMGDYVPSAPVNDEARKRNQSLPGMGGVFNYVNLHAYHYAGNNPVKYVDPDGRQSGPPGAPPSNIPGVGSDGWKFSPDPRNRRGGVWRPNPSSDGPQVSVSWEPPGGGRRGKGVGHWDADDGQGNRQRYLPDGTPITEEQAHGDEPLPNSSNNTNTPPTPDSSNDTDTSPDYNITDPGGLLNPDITNPDFVPKKPSTKPPIIIPVPVPGFRFRLR